MTMNPISVWLQRRIKSTINLHYLFAVAAFFIALALLSITFWVIWALLGFVFAFIGSNLLHFLATLAVMAMLFTTNWLVPKPAKAKIIPGVPASKNSKVEAPSDSLQTFLRVAVTFLCCGPKALSYAADMYKKAQHMKKMDIDGCAAVLELLITRESRIPYAEIKLKLPKLDTVSVFGQIEYVEGVLLLDSDPPGVSLTDALRRELMMFKS